MATFNPHDGVGTPAPALTAPVVTAQVTSRPAVPPPGPPSQATAPSGAPAVTVTFAPQSAEISEAGCSALDAMARSAVERGVKQIEVRAYAGGTDAGDARKVALARALSVRSYLIDQGVTARIEVGAFAATQRGAGGERVDVVLP